MRKVRSKRLGDLINLKRGYDLPESKRTHGKYPVITSAGISSYHNEYKVEGIGVVIGRYGTLGDAHFIDGRYWPHNTSLYVTDFKRNSPLYIYYLLTCLGRIKTSDKSAVPGVNRNELHEMSVPAVFDCNLQERIASVLSILDAKIELNNRINAELEGMAKLLYDYWFVQFDFPITADQAAAMGKPKLEGKPYRASGGKMVYNEKLKREIPEGWGCVALGEFEPNIITGKTPPTSVAEYYNGDIPFICIGDVRGNMHVVKTGLTLSKLGAETQKKKYIPKGAICVTCIASPGLIAFATENSQTNQQLNSVVCQRIEHRAFLYFELNQFFRFSSGAKTGNTFANMSKGDFSEILVLEPPNKVIQLFHELISSNIELVLNNSLQNQELTKLRDWLLPMLMNGQVTVGS